MWRYHQHELPQYMHIYILALCTRTLRYEPFFLFNFTIVKGFVRKRDKYTFCWCLAAVAGRIHLGEFLWAKKQWGKRRKCILHSIFFELSSDERNKKIMLQNLAFVFITYHVLLSFLQCYFYIKMFFFIILSTA